MKSITSQTVESIMAAYDTEYNSQKPNAKQASSVKDRTIEKDAKDPCVDLFELFNEETMNTEKNFDNLDLSDMPQYFTIITDSSTGKKRIIEYTLADVDAKYPRNKWVQMLLDKDVSIENYKDYEEYLNIRTQLFSKEYLADSEEDVSDLSTYIDKRIQEYQRIQAARKTDPNVKDWTVIGENALPSISGRMYVCKTESGYKIRSKTTSNKKPKLTDEQKSNLQDKGIEPEGWEVVYIDEKGNVL